MKCFYQVVGALDGLRSDAFSLTPVGMAVSLRRLVEQAPECADDLVLVLGDDLGSSNGEWGFSKAPIIKVSTFIERFHPIDEVIDNV